MTSDGTLDRIDAVLEDWERGPDAMAWNAEHGPHSRADEWGIGDFDVYHPTDEVWVRIMSMLAIEGRLIAERFRQGERAAFTLIDEVNLNAGAWEAWDRLLRAARPPELSPEARAAVDEAFATAEAHAGLADWPRGDLPKCITSREAT